ncbi:MAG TPA: 23S rRNA (uracil(1939)-C(5))-methyltransferase RlmD [Candidatus Aminicenantes bacterium]|nr:23S rRNA (uracil(1939)-C(5))-methyltransferase RlmD [Candidatus Aminicenantes bacterium]HRY64666.1 23S rRNA (uracil(1939)-C(5))-methyltransferase RlmD [Candidatus Aminicenantes bacterium]HRZ71579.1 23S rRNA (uracil(1939)-C(5))-methyltransferase RlmD [Candidatus Aminicenantes bacterium]
MDIVLASASPRRRELMARVAPEFRVFPTDVDESAVREKDPLQFAVVAAAMKARRAAETFPEAVVIGADTVVALGLRILGKPADREDARAMLRSLSGRRHRVITGLAFYTRSEDRLLTGYDLTYVTFRELTEEMIEGYLDQGTFLDKAGAYAVQEVGDAFVARLKGDYDNVVGFPVEKVRRLLARFAAPAFTVGIEDLGFPGSDGLARDGEGRRVLVPGAVPGERVRVQVVAERGAARIAEVVRLESPSPRRAEPRCPHFGACGGCLFQHVDYRAQLELKEGHLKRTLEESGRPGLAAAVRPITPSPDLYGYRNKMEFAFGERHGELALGLRERVTTSRQTYRRTLPVGTCPIFGPVVERVFPVVLEFARENGFQGFEPATGKGELRHLVLRQAKRTGELMIVLATAGIGEAGLDGLAGRLAAAAPEMRSFVHVSSRRGSDIVEYEQVRVVAGVPFIEERLAGRTFRIYPPSFFQTNTAGAELLYGRLAEEARLTPASRVLGLYCGSGAIELSIAGRAGRVTGVDSSPANIANAVENALLNGVTNADFVPGTVEALLAEPRREPVDVVIVDPPRVGLTGQALRRAAALGAPVLVYVSCNPRSLARDLLGLVDAGYEAVSIAPFDLFPHTPHLETLAVLTR